MRISGSGTETYLYINGLAVSRHLALAANVEILPASCAPHVDDLLEVFKKQVDFGVANALLPLVGSQLRITAPTAEQLARHAWNSVWDAVILSALFDCEAVCNFQCDRPAEDFGPLSAITVTNYHLRGLAQPHQLTSADEAWIEAQFAKARNLLEDKTFLESINALASFRWHSLPRVQLAVIWAGIEALFGVDSELVFRISLYAARFLHPDHTEARSATFEHVKSLYKQRSQAVHGAKVKGDPKQAIAESAALLKQLLLRCIELSAMPNPKLLAP